MAKRLMAAALLFTSFCAAVIIDRIAITVGNSIVKDSDIARDLRVTDFLNNVPLDMSMASRKKAATRLIDQIFIRREIQVGDYPTATLEEADQQLDELKKQRFKSDATLNSALRRYGLTPLDLRTQFQWQLTVLRFIDLRFKPAVLVTDQEIQRYYQEHAAALQRQHPGKASLDDMTNEIRETLTEERVNKVFFAWLDDQRKSTKIVYLEEDLA
jgi:parvulin-like peptidyl-prolyl isomerase